MKDQCKKRYSFYKIHPYDIKNSVHQTPWVEKQPQTIYVTL